MPKSIKAKIQKLKKTDVALATISLPQSEPQNLHLLDDTIVAAPDPVQPPPNVRSLRSRHPPLVRPKTNTPNLTTDATIVNDTSHPPASRVGDSNDRGESGTRPVTALKVVKESAGQVSPCDIAGGSPLPESSLYIPLPAPPSQLPQALQIGHGSHHGNLRESFPANTYRSRPFSFLNQPQNPRISDRVEGAGIGQHLVSR